MPTDRPLLLPTPKRLRLTGDAVDVHADPATIGRCDAATRLPPGGYRLVIGAGAGAGNVELSASSDDGLRNGRATLRHLFKQYGTRLPSLEVEDAPAFATRGVMLDISRDRVPTAASLRGSAELVEIL